MIIGTDLIKERHIVWAVKGLGTGLIEEEGRTLSSLGPAYNHDDEKCSKHLTNHIT